MTLLVEFSFVNFSIDIDWKVLLIVIGEKQS